MQVRVDDDVDAAGVEVLLLITHRGQNELGEAGGPKTLTTNCSRAADRGTSSSAHTNRTGGVDQDVDTTFLGEDLLDAGLHRSVVADVHRQGLDAPLAECSIRSIAGLPRTSWASSRNFSAVASPIPDEPPVTNATFAAILISTQPCPFSGPK